MVTSSLSPTKRARESDGDRSPIEPASAPNDSRTKRSRRTRWETSEAKDTAAASTVAPDSAKSKLSEIVARLSTVVKEKSTPQQLAMQATPLNSLQLVRMLSHAEISILSIDTRHLRLFSQLSADCLVGLGAPVDAETAKARALAQASLLSLNLPVTQVSPTDLARRLYIGNLYYELREDDIRNTFATFGTIKSIDLSLEPGHNRSKGFCFLEFDDVLAAENAVQLLNGSLLSNRTIRVGRPHRGSSNPGDPTIGLEAIKNLPTKCIYVGNVRVELNSHHLESIFSPFGVIRACVMAAISPLEANVHRGYGFLEFTEESGALNAIQHMNGFELAGQNLRVGKASPAAIGINLAMSSDKVVRDENGELSAGTGHAPKKTAVFDDDDVEGVRDVAEPNKEKRCLCLLNMVGKGEVDDELEDEVREECSRFGPVQTVSIQELEDHVRVFVLFHDEASALKGKQALHGRFFGGNQVQANYYPVDEMEAKRYRSAFL